MLGLRLEPINACREDSLHCGRSLDGSDRLNEAMMSMLASQGVRLEQGADGLLDKERVATFHEELLERGEARVVAENRIQQVSGTLRRQRI